jgi:hypothetical protein
VQSNWSSARFEDYSGGGGNVTGKCFNVSCHFTKTKQWSTER